MQIKLAVSVRGHRFFGALAGMLALFSLVPSPILASAKSPAHTVHLVPPKARYLSASRGMFETEFEYSYGADLADGNFTPEFPH
jgi:hypothetical protein